MRSIRTADWAALLRKKMGSATWPEDRLSGPRPYGIMLRLMEMSLRRLLLPALGVCAIGLIAGGVVYRTFFTREARKERAFESGRKMLSENRLKEAQIQFQRTVNYDPNFAMAQYLLGHTSIQLQDYTRAYAALKKSVEF